MDTDDKNVLLKARDIVLMQIDFVERASNHKPMTNAILADYAYDNPDTLLQPVKRLIEPEHSLDARQLKSVLSLVETIAGLEIKTSDVIRAYKRQIGFVGV